MVEEFSKTDNTLLVRRWKQVDVLGRAGKWLYEIGEEAPRAGMTSSASAGLLAASASSPIFVPRDKKSRFEWRIRNLPYPKETYKFEVDDAKQQIILRTTNKKYFKRWDVPLMKRLGESLAKTNLLFKHAHNTLIIQYKKPAKVKQFEAFMAKQRASAGASKAEKPPDCATQ